LKDPSDTVQRNQGEKAIYERRKNLGEKVTWSGRSLGKNYRTSQVVKSGGLIGISMTKTQQIKTNLVVMERHVGNKNIWSMRIKADHAC